jgi:hypothetical protein
MQVCKNFIVESYSPWGNDRRANASVGITVWTFHVGDRKYVKIGGTVM